jgi:hypothetical protein
MDANYQLARVLVADREAALRQTSAAVARRPQRRSRFGRRGRHSPTP